MSQAGFSSHIVEVSHLSAPNSQTLYQHNWSSLSRFQFPTLSQMLCVYVCGPTGWGGFSHLGPSDRGVFFHFVSPKDDSTFSQGWHIGESLTQGWVTGCYCSTRNGMLMWPFSSWAFGCMLITAGLLASGLTQLERHVSVGPTHIFYCTWTDLHFFYFFPSYCSADVIALIFQFHSAVETQPALGNDKYIFLRK